jgi:hypothetical protein
MKKLIITTMMVMMLATPVSANNFTASGIFSTITSTVAAVLGTAVGGPVAGAAAGLAAGATTDATIAPSDKGEIDVSTLPPAQQVEIAKHMEWTELLIKFWQYFLVAGLAWFFIPMLIGYFIPRKSERKMKEMMFDNPDIKMKDLK